MAIFIIPAKLQYDATVSIEAETEEEARDYFECYQNVIDEQLDGLLDWEILGKITKGED